MLRRLPASQRPGDQTPTTATSGGFGLISRPFKAPTPLGPKRDLALPARKRKAVSYKDAGGDGDENDADENTDDHVAKKIKYAMGNKEYGADGVLGGMGKLCNRKFAVFKPKEKSTVFAKRSVDPRSKWISAHVQLQHTGDVQPEDVGKDCALAVACFARRTSTSQPRPSAAVRPHGGSCDSFVRPDNR